MGLFDFISKNKEEREEDARVKEVLERTDETMARIEKELDRMEKEDEVWKKIIGY